MTRARLIWAVVAEVTKNREQKDDRRDGYGLAEKLRMGTLDKRNRRSSRSENLPL